MRRISYLFVLLGLSACEGLFSKSVGDICEERPELCNDLNPDSWCRAEKAKIIKHRYVAMKTPSDELTYRLLLNFEDYKACVTKAAQIEHIKLKEKERGRMRGLLTAERELKRMTRETKDSNTPLLAYYHWSRFNDQRALKRFLRYEHQPEMQTPELQVALASYYVKFDLQKAVSQMLHSLELLQAQDSVNTEIFRSLTTSYLKLEDYKNAYVWAYIAKHYELEATLDLVQLETLLLQNNISAKPLRERAEDYLSQIKQRNFRA